MILSILMVRRIETFTNFDTGKSNYFEAEHHLIPDITFKRNGEYGN